MLAAEIFNTLFLVLLTNTVCLGPPRACPVIFKHMNPKNMVKMMPCQIMDNYLLLANQEIHSDPSVIYNLLIHFYSMCYAMSCFLKECCTPKLCTPLIGSDLSQHYLFKNVYPVLFLEAYQSRLWDYNTIWVRWQYTLNKIKSIKPVKTIIKANWINPFPNSNKDNCFMLWKPA